MCVYLLLFVLFSQFISLLLIDTYILYRKTNSCMGSTNIQFFFQKKFYVNILPPNESRSNLVSFESRTGTCGLFSASALMHFPSALKERLIDLASSSIWPSLPAK